MRQARYGHVDKRDLHSHPTYFCHAKQLFVTLAEVIKNRVMCVLVRKAL